MRSLSINQSNLRFKKKKKLTSTGLANAIFITFGMWGLKATGSGRLTSKQIETARQAIARCIKPSGKLWVRVYPNTPVTSVPSKTRMGKGKGRVDYEACSIKKGQILFEVGGVPADKAMYALVVGGSKLPFSTKIIEY